MRRYGNLFPEIVTRANLSLAFWKATSGKRHRPSVRSFADDLDERLSSMCRQLENGTFHFGRYFQFTIRDPKLRKISAPCFAERVVHHALFNVCESVFHRLAIADTFACFVGRGQVKAVRRAQRFSRSYPWYLKLDVRKYFESISHDLLLQRLARKFKEPKLLRLFESIIRSFSASAGHGLPIGALTSQHFANYYLDALDRFIKQDLRTRGYVRYMDDMIVWSDDKRQLEGLAETTDQFLRGRLRLRLKHAYVNRSAAGVTFLGLRVSPISLRLGPRAKRNARNRYREYTAKFARGRFGERELQQRLACLVALLENADTMEFRKRLFACDGAGPD